MFPSMGSPLSSRVSFKTDYKYLVYRNYITIYLLRKDHVEIYRVLDGH